MLEQRDKTIYFITKNIVILLWVNLSFNQKVKNDLFESCEIEHGYIDFNSIPRSYNNEDYCGTLIHKMTIPFLQLQEQMLQYHAHALSLALSFTVP